jgi:hypothetical protein
MITACIRCHGRATTLLTYHHADARAYLDDAHGHERVYDGIALCAIHAERFSAPLGWTTLDRRSNGSDALTEPKGG